MTKVSIIIPVYNAVKSLPYLLADLQKQTYQDAEFIMVNDGSTDESAQVIADFIKKQTTSNNSYILIDQADEGVSAARNNGLRHAGGEYVMFADSDDRFAPNFVEEYVKAIEQNQTDIEIFSLSKVNDLDTLNEIGRVDYTDLAKQGILSGSDYFKYLAADQIYAYPHSYIFKRTLWQGRQFDPNVSYQEDRLAFSLIVANTPGIKIHVNQESYYYYYIHDDSATRKLPAAKLEETIIVDQRIIHAALKSGNIDVSEAVLNQLITSTYWQMLVLSVQQDDQKQFNLAKRGFLHYVGQTEFNTADMAKKRKLQAALLRLNLDFVVKSKIRH